uniref:Uncharacterized protein n=1 Tax=Catharus ustulatus TaxID=91951 RepID=A0A8C3TJH9_CATUS
TFKSILSPFLCPLTHREAWLMNPYSLQRASSHSPWDCQGNQTYLKCFIHSEKEKLQQKRQQNPGINPLLRWPGKTC